MRKLIQNSRFFNRHSRCRVSDIGNVRGFCDMIKTVSVIIINQYGKILALKRRVDKEWYPDKWDIISGKFNEIKSAKECFEREIREEIGVSVFKEIEERDPYTYKEKGQ